MLTTDELGERMADWAEAAVPEPDVDLPRSTLIETHAHVFPIRPTWGPGGTDADALVANMDAAGVDRAVILAEEQVEKSFKVPSWWVVEQAERYPDRLIPFLVFDPRTLASVGEDAIDDLFARYLDAGVRGVGELKAGLAVDDERMQLLYERCAEADLPVVVHVDDRHATDEAGLPDLERMVETYSETNFVVHAHGWWAHVSGDVTEDEVGGFPEGPVEPGGRCDELLGAYDNLYADFSPSGFNALTRDPEFGQAFLERNHDSLVFGTDASYCNDPRAYGEPLGLFGFFSRFDLSAEAWADIRYRNAEHLLGFDDEASEESDGREGREAVGEGA